MCLLLQPQNKKINVQENPCERAPPLRSVPLAFIIKLFILIKFFKKYLTNNSLSDIIYVLFDYKVFASVLE